MRAPLPVLALAVLTALAFTGCAAKLPEDHTRSLVEAERAFSRESGAQGSKAAFLNNLAVDAVVFGPGPIPGRSHYREQPDAGPTLSWEPSYAEVSRGGDLGYTVGPYRLTEPNGTARFGHYVSVWQKQGKRWMVVVDGGVEHLPPLQVSEPLTQAPLTAAPAQQLDFTAELRRLMTTDEALSAAWTGPGSQALLAHATDDIRYFVPEILPLTGRGAVQANLATSREALTFTQTGAGLASSGDLGYTHGDATRKLGPEAPVQRGGYLRVWRRSAADVWQVALELHVMPRR
jgi:ketosteroid isomerase-like protein